MIILSPFMLIIGVPGLGKKDLTLFQRLGVPSIEVTIYILVGIIVFKIGYDGFLQGPLSIIEYVLFPLMAHFLHLGETFAVRSKQIFYSLLEPKDPWAYWARLKDKHED